MPLTPLQCMVVKVLRPFRTEHNYVAGGAVLNYQWPRLSDDMDIFQDHRNRLLNNVEPELQALRDAEFSVEITTRDEWMVEAIVRKYDFETKLQWLEDPETCKRFFPAIDDDELGFRLHQADIAVNKVLCVSRRHEARDAVDLVTIVRRYAALGPLVWAVTGKDPDRGPPQVLSSIRAVAFGFSDAEIRTVRMEDGSTVTRAELREVLTPALDDANEYCEEVAPIDYNGCLFVDANEKPVEDRDEDITNGTASAIPLKDFTIVPTIRNLKQAMTRGRTSASGH